jgi:hypothetical protein
MSSLTLASSLAPAASDGRHERHDAFGNRAEVLILELLALRRRGAEERSARVDEIGPRQIEVVVDEEVFLLGTAGGDDALG